MTTGGAVAAFAVAMSLGGCEPLCGECESAMRRDDLRLDAAAAADADTRAADSSAAAETRADAASAADAAAADPGAARGTGGCTTGASHYPLQPGAWWVHRTFDADSLNPLCPDKVVVVGEPGPIVSAADASVVLRAGVTAFDVLSVSADNGVGHRWQEVRDDGVYRHIDEWFDGRTGEPTRVDHYCPRRLRVPDTRLCAGEGRDDAYARATVTAGPGGDWATCRRIAIDPATCEPASSVPGCVVNVLRIEVDWFVEAVDEPIEVPGGTFPATRLRTVTHKPDGSVDVERNWWRRGVGKIKEDANPFEQLVDYCAGDCARSAPDVAALEAACER